MKAVFDIKMILQDRRKTRVVWHLGFQKTATTTIQESLIENSKNLEFEVLLVARGQDGNAIEQAGKRVLRSGKFVRFSWLRKLRFGLQVVALFLRTRSHPKRTALISNEVIIGNWIYLNDITIFDEAEEIIRLIGLFSWPYRSELVFYYRDFEKWLKSAWSQEVLVRRGRKDYDVWRADLPFETRWEPNLKRIQTAANKAGLKVHFLKFEDAAASGAFVENLLTICDVSPEAIAAVEPYETQNISGPSSFRDFLLILNRSDISHEDHTQARVVFQANYDLFEPSLGGEGKAFAFSGEKQLLKLVREAGVSSVAIDTIERIIANGEQSID